MSAPNKQDLERVVLEAQQQIQMQAQQALMEKMNTICFRRCVPSPMEVGDRQRRCLQQCVGAFLEGWGVAVRRKAGAALLSYTFMRARVAGCGRRAPAGARRGARLRAPSLAASPPSRVLTLLQPLPARAQNETFASIAKKQMAASGGGHE